MGFTWCAVPMWLCPRSDSYETVEDGRFRFHVEISVDLGRARHPVPRLARALEAEAWREKLSLGGTAKSWQQLMNLNVLFRSSSHWEADDPAIRGN